MLIGDAAGLLNVPKIKGTHQAIRSAMLAAEHVGRNRQGRRLGREAARIAGDGGTAEGAQHPAGLQQGTVVRPCQRGLGNGHRRPVAVDAEEPGGLVVAEQGRRRTNRRKRDYVERTLPPRDRLAGVYFAATEHDEDQPVHLRVADTEHLRHALRRGIRQSVPRFCPAARLRDRRATPAGKRLQINAANCVHCKTCDIKDPYEIIDWVTPEGGSGPNYQNL